MRAVLSREKILILVRWITIASSLVAVFFIAWTGNWVTAAKPARALPGQGVVVDLWFSSDDNSLFLLEQAGEDQLRLKKWGIKEKKFIDIQLLNLRILPRVGIGSQKGGSVGFPLLTVSRDGSRVAWIANGLLCGGSSENFNGALCEASIELDSWQKAAGLSFFGNSNNLLGVVFADGKFRVFDMSRGENTTRPGSEFLGPWALRSQGGAIIALPEPRSGNLACIEMLGGRIHPYTPDLSPLVINAVSARDCEHIVIGTSDGLILPISSKRVSDVADNAVYGNMSGPVRALALSPDGVVFVAGDFEGIYRVNKGEASRKILESDAHVRLIEISGENLVYLASVPTLVELGREWQPSSMNLFVVNLVVVVASLFAFLYTIFAEKSPPAT
jgi:hypothetical protein